MDRWYRYLTVAIAWGLLDSVVCAQPPVPFPGAPGSPVSGSDDDNPRGLHLPTDRLAARGLAEAQQRIAAGQYSQAIRFLDEILGEHEDSFVALGQDGNRFSGLKAQAQRMLGALPDDARRAYNSTFGTTARKRLEAAAAAGNYAGIEQVARRYFHTPAGYEATLILASQEWDMGRPLASAILLSELTSSDEAVKTLGPQLFLQAARAWMFAGQSDQAAHSLEQLKARFPRAQLTIGGRQVQMFRDSDDPLAWLKRHVGEADNVASMSQLWTMYRGGPSRNGQTAGGMPHMNVRWRSRTANLPTLQDLTGALKRGYQRRDVVVISATQPVAAGNVVVTRTARKIVAVDLESGNRLWDVTPHADDDYDQLLIALQNGSASESIPHAASSLEQRIWDDAVYGNLSSDGENVYAVRGLPLSYYDAEQAMQRVVPGFGRGRGRPEPEAPTNTLTALQLSTEGKRLWEIDGGDVTGELEGAFFLGPPLCVDGRLYVLAEVKGSIRLAVLRNTDSHPYWQLDWVQQLANLEMGINLDPGRRLAGAMPSFHQGILVCPTSAGVVVAIDVTRRSLLWAYRYSQNDDAMQISTPWSPVASSPVAGLRENNRWIDSTPILVDDRVLLTPRESDELHCLQLATGNLIWKRKRGDSLFVAAVHDGTVALVAPHAVEAVGIEDGKNAWDIDARPLPLGAMPSGRGFMTAGTYFLPLDSAEVISLDIAKGDITGKAVSREAHVLGNLVAHRGTIISQSESQLIKYEQSDSFRERAQTLLAADANNPNALRDLGEVALSEGDVSEAIRQLKRSYAIDAQDSATRSMLASALLDGLEVDFALYRQDISMMRQLAEASSQKARLARLTAQGLQATGEGLRAFESYLQLAKIDMANPQMQEMSRDWEARTSRWISAQLGELWRAASPDEKSQMVQILDQQLPLADAGALEKLSREIIHRVQNNHSQPTIRLTLDEVSRYLQYIGQLDVANALRFDLVDKRITSSPDLSVELALMVLESQTPVEQQDMRASALAWHAHLLTKFGRDRSAMILGKRLRVEFASATLPGGQSGRAFADQLADTTPPNPHFPFGQIVAFDPVGLDGNDDTDQLHALRVDGPFDPALEGYRFFLDQSNQSLVVLDPFGRKEADVPLAPSGDAPLGFNLTAVRCHAKLCGHLLVVSFGEQIVGIDLMRRTSLSSRMLWRVSTVEPFESIAEAKRYPHRARRSVNRQNFTAAKNGYAVDEARRPLGWIGPVTPHGVVFQAKGELLCVDPMSGETLWKRTDLPPGCALFGDEQFVFALPHQSEEAVVLRAHDGKRLGTRKVPRLDEHLQTFGRNILRWYTAKSDDGPSVRAIELLDPWTNEIRWSHRYAFDANESRIDGQWVGVMERSGKFDLIDIPTGNTIISEQLIREDVFREMYLTRSSDRIVLITNRGSTVVRGGNQVSSIYVPDYPIVSGRVHVFSRTTGKPLLPVPAEVDLQGYYAPQPPELPILTFMSLFSDRSSRGRRNNISVLVLDKRTGATIERTQMNNTSTSRCRIYLDDTEDAAINIDLAKQSLRFEFTSVATAPVPPANSNVEGRPRRSRRGGVFSIFGG